MLARLTQQLVELWKMTLPPLLGPLLALLADFFLSLLRPLGKKITAKPSNCDDSDVGTSDKPAELKLNLNGCPLFLLFFGQSTYLTPYFTNNT